MQRVICIGMVVRYEFDGKNIYRKDDNKSTDPICKHGHHVVGQIDALQLVGLPPENRRNCGKRKEKRLTCHRGTSSL